MIHLHQSDGKKSFSIEKKKILKDPTKILIKSIKILIKLNERFKKKNFARKFIEQQATKDFIKKITNQLVKVN